MAICRTRIRRGSTALSSHPSPRPLCTYCFSYKEPWERPHSTKCSGKLLSLVRNWVPMLAVSRAAWLVARVQQSCANILVQWCGEIVPHPKQFLTPCWPYANNGFFSPTPEKPALLLDFGPRVKLELSQNNPSKNDRGQQLIMLWRLRSRKRGSAAASLETWAPKLEVRWGGTNCL